MVKQISLNLDGDIKQVVNVNPVFARHETFHPRFGWIKKGFDAALNSFVFVQEDAPVRLGVGKNMVSSIRYWCNGFKVLENDKPSDFGDRLLKDDGWDPYLEDPASLWLLHWNLLKPPCNAVAWYFIGLTHALRILGGLGTGSLTAPGNPSSALPLSWRFDKSRFLAIFA